jgi:hypothetical protein
MCTLMTGTPTSASSLLKYGRSRHAAGSSGFSGSTARAAPAPSRARLVAYLMLDLGCVARRQVDAQPTARAISTTCATVLGQDSVMHLLCVTHAMLVSHPLAHLTLWHGNCLNYLVDITSFACLPSHTLARWPWPWRDGPANTTPRHAAAPGMAET